MLSKSFLAIRAVALVLPLACSESPGDDATGGGGTGPSSGGAAGSAGSAGMAGSAGTAGSAGSGGMAGLAGAAGTAGSAGTGGAAGMVGDDRLFVPEGLLNTDLDGEGGLTLIALTLVQGATGAELYAAVRNDGAAPACEAGMMTDFVDETEAVVGSSTGTLESGQLYRFTDGSGVIITCLAPGQIAMTASTELPASVVIEELGELRHRFPAFLVDGIEPIDGGITVGVLETVSRGAGTAYTGTLSNGLDVTVRDPSVSVFPVNRVGRPLGMATSSAAVDVPPGGSWTFETTPVNAVGAGEAVFPAASLP